MINLVENEKRLVALTAWPDGRVEEKLTNHEIGMNWEHVHRGHKLFYSECYACVCEDAY